MKNALSALCVGLLYLFCGLAKAQNSVPSVKIISVKAQYTSKDSALILVDSLQKQPASLSYDQNYLLFRFVNKQDSSRKSFSYKLKGLDYEWIACNNCTEVQYAHLDGGEYIFQVKANTPNAQPAEFSFKIEGNIWHRWWFVPMLFLYFLVLFGIGVYFFVLYQFRQKLKAQRLIHKEKMSSMAELTSGIAHEIQNPLNFVNNFSQMSVELAQELKDEIEQATLDKELISDLVTDLIQNQQKINQHGQRASGIVKAMVEHSRSTAGERQLTDLNKLTDASLRHCYVDFQKKDKNVEVVYQTNFDESLSAINVVPQELDRVLRNLISNAFYTVQEKSLTGLESYQPSIWITTKKVGKSVHISIKDNGMGVAADILPKIFQPFFTTKPTGEGTGLGLSLAYDIITKGHGGTIEVESVEGEGSTFVIKLPISIN